MYFRRILEEGTWLSKAWVNRQFHLRRLPTEQLSRGDSDDLGLVICSGMSQWAVLGAGELLGPILCIVGGCGWQLALCVCLGS